MGRSNLLLANLCALCVLAGAVPIDGQERVLPWKHALDLPPGRTLTSVWRGDPKLGPTALFVDFDRQLSRLGAPGPVPSTPTAGRTLWFTSDLGSRLGRVTFSLDEKTASWRTTIVWWSGSLNEDPHVVELDGIRECLLAETGQVLLVLEHLREPRIHRLRFFGANGGEGTAIDLGQAAHAPLEGVALSADGTRLATRHPELVQVFELRPGNARLLYELPSAGRVELSPSGRYAALYELDSVRVFDGTEPIESIAASPPLDTAFARGWFAVIDEHALTLRALEAEDSTPIPPVVLPEGATLRSVDLAVRNGRPRVVVGILQEQRLQAWIEVLDVGLDVGWRRWGSFQPESINALSPDVSLLDGGQRVLAQTRDRLRFTDEL